MQQDNGHYHQVIGPGILHGVVLTSAGEQGITRPQLTLRSVVIDLGSATQDVKDLFFVCVDMPADRASRPKSELGQQATGSLESPG